MSQKIIPITHFGISKFKKIASMLECKNHKELVVYIKQYAYRHSKDNLYKTYILIDESENPIAYISFSLSNIDSEEKLHKKAGISSAITYPISALKITRLLVDDRMQG